MLRSATLVSLESVVLIYFRFFIDSKEAQIIFDVLSLNHLTNDWDEEENLIGTGNICCNMILCYPRSNLIFRCDKLLFWNNLLTLFDQIRNLAKTKIAQLICDGSWCVLQTRRWWRPQQFDSACWARGHGFSTGEDVEEFFVQKFFIINLDNNRLKNKFDVWIWSQAFVMFINNFFC